jgi:hydroxypyruvate reductase
MAGVAIQPINTIRKHLERWKGGRLAAFLPGLVHTLILSDVIGSPIESIGSGPTVPDPSTFEDALAALAGLEQRIPRRVLAHLRAGAAGVIPETPKPSEALWKRVSADVIGSNIDALKAAKRVAVTQGWLVIEEPEPLSGEAASVGWRLVGRLKELAARHRPVMLLAGGETTVTIDHSQLARNTGGRNQELALAAAIELAQCPNCALVALATDGIDGPTPVAGAIATSETMARSAALGLDAEHALHHHLSYPFWQSLGDALILGPTNTNVNDLVIAVAW